MKSAPQTPLILPGNDCRLMMALGLIVLWYFDTLTNAYISKEFETQ